MHTLFINETHNQRLTVDFFRPMCTNRIEFPFLSQQQQQQKNAPLMTQRIGECHVNTCYHWRVNGNSIDSTISINWWNDARQTNEISHIWIIHLIEFFYENDGRALLSSFAIIASRECFKHTNLHHADVVITNANCYFSRVFFSMFSRHFAHGSTT